MNNMNCIIFGLGRMGRATAWAMTKLGYDVKGVDRKEVCEEVLELGYCKEVYWGEGDIKGCIHTKPDVVISCLPYFENYEIAKECIKYRVRYCDLGGSVPISEKINEFANACKTTRPVFTDLGLAPGLVNIICEKEMKKFPLLPTDVKLYVGGMNQFDHDHPMLYTCNWSIEGLVNEYWDDCKIITNGEERTVKGMAGYERLDDEGYEAFYTSGGLAHTLRLMLARGVQNCAYKTLRYIGHYRQLHLLTDIMKYDKNQFQEFLNKACKGKFINEDVVTIIVTLQKDNIASLYKTYQYGNEDHETDFSAMQKCTALPLAAVADLMAKGEMDGRSNCHYGHVANLYYPLLDNLTKLGLIIDDDQLTGTD